MGIVGVLAGWSVIIRPCFVIRGSGVVGDGKWGLLD